MITGGGGGSAAPAIPSGTAAARPAASAVNANTPYYATDTGELTISNGAAWNAIQSVGGAFTINGVTHLNNAMNANGNFVTNLAYLSPLGSPLQIKGGSVDVFTVGDGLQVAEGSNAKQGVATLAAGTVVVPNTSVTATSRILLTPQDNNTAGALRVSARTAGTSFTILSSNAADTGVVAYQIFEPG